MSAEKIIEQINNKIKPEVIAPLQHATLIITNLEDWYTQEFNKAEELRQKIEDNKEAKEKARFFEEFEINPELFFQKYEEYKEKVRDFLHSKYDKKIEDGVNITSQSIQGTLLLFENEEQFKSNLLLQVAKKEVQKEWKEKYCLK